MRAATRLAILGLIACGLMLPGATLAQSGASQYFPETGRTVGGRFYEFWRQNGGLAVFGFPLSDQFQENGRAVQYFERQRFELHPENLRPYDVLLGRLGAERLSSGAPAPTVPGGSPGCVYFAVTQHNLCNGQGFLSYWRSHGLEFDGRPGKSEAESLALFGYPLTEAYDYTNSSGQTVLAQWFERARFEWHPNNPNPYKVLLGRLGAEVLQPPQPPGVSQVNLFMVALNDGGRSGKPIGCGDSIVPVQIPIEPTPAPLRAALTQLLAQKNQYFGSTGLYNALYQSDLRLDAVSITNGRASVTLSGTARLSGTCDTPRLRAQIEETVLQFSTVSGADILLNGRPLADALSQR